MTVTMASTSESMVVVEPGDSGLVIWYQVDEYIHNWLAECFVAWSLINPGFMGEVWTLPHFPIGNQVVRIIPSWLILQSGQLS